MSRNFKCICFPACMHTTYKQQQNFIQFATFLGGIICTLQLHFLDNSSKILNFWMNGVNFKVTVIESFLFTSFLYCFGKQFLKSFFDFEVLSFAKNGEKTVKYYMLKQNHEWVWNRQWTCLQSNKAIKRSWNQDAGTHWSSWNISNECKNEELNKWNQYQLIQSFPTLIYSSKALNTQS